MQSHFTTIALLSVVEWSQSQEYPHVASVPNSQETSSEKEMKARYGSAQTKFMY